MASPLTTPYINPYYTFFFTTFEPITALLGFFAALNPYRYLSYLSPSVHYRTLGDPTSHVVTYQIANLYLFFAITEALVFRTARHDLKTQRALAFAMLVADVGHLAAALPLGTRQFWDIGVWGPMEFGGIGIVYVGFLTRCLFLSGVGVGSRKIVKSQ